jgi:hypothetical protein
MRSIGAPIVTRHIERLPLLEEANILLGGHPSLKRVMIPADEFNEEEPLVVFERGAFGGISQIGKAKSWRGKVVKTVID